jgi:hypothetical protein
MAERPLSGPRSLMTQSGRRPHQNSAAQQARTRCGILSVEGKRAPERTFSIQNDSGPSKDLPHRGMLD